MPVINITPEMLEAGKPWPEGWVKATLVDFVEETSKAKDSINYMPVYEFGWTSDNSNIPGRQLSKFAHLMNNKNPGMFAQNFIPFVAAVMDINVSEVNIGAFDTDKAKGKQVWLEISKVTYNGNIQDRVVGVVSQAKVPF